jgi:hypothetical protein
MENQLGGIENKVLSTAEHYTGGLGDKLIYI